MQKLWMQVLIIVALTSLVYIQAPSASFMPVDDGSLTYKNPLVTTTSVDSLKGMFSTYDPELYVPLTLLSFQFDYSIGGEDPMMFHITNLILHIANAVMVLLLVRLLVPKPWVGLLTALLFALHPINTEAVLWISGRKDLLSASFFLGSLLMYCTYRTRHSRLPYYLSILLFACALMSKVVTATLPLVLIIVDDLLCTSNDRSQKLRKIPYYLLATVFVFVGMFGKSLSVYFLSYAETFLLAGKSVAFYVQKLLIPTGLMPLYQQSLPIHPLTPEFILPFAVLALLYVIAIASRPIHRSISFGILWYGITLLPSLGSFNRGNGWGVFFASDRYAYLPSIGLLMVLSVGIMQLPWKKWQAPLSIAIVTVLGCLSYHQTTRWLTPDTLFTYVANRAPQTYLAHALLGLQDLEADRYDDAVVHLQRSVELYPNAPEARAHLGLALMKSGAVSSGMAEITQTIASNADYVPAYVYQAYGYVLKEDVHLAEQSLDRVLQLEPTNAKAFQLLGVINEQRGNLKEAEESYRRSLELNPRSIQTMSALAKILNK